jgi:hypothetical protein
VNAPAQTQSLVHQFTKVPWILAILLLLTSSLLTNTGDLQTSLTEMDQEETLDFDEFDSFIVSSNVTLRKRARKVLSLTISGRSNSCAKTLLAIETRSNPPGFSSQDLHTLQMVFRI